MIFVYVHCYPVMAHSEPGTRWAIPFARKADLGLLVTMETGKIRAEGEGDPPG